MALSGLVPRDWRAAGDPPALGDAVVVVGGGDAAMDCARSALRIGAHAVKVLYRRARRDMPCLMEEVEGAEAEGVVFEFLGAPARMMRTAGR